MSENNLAFGKENYMIVIAGFILVIIGFILMSGGGSDNPAEFNPEIFNFRRITLAPIVVLSGYIVVMFGIIRRPKA